MCRTIPTLSYFYFFLNKRFAHASNALGNTFRHVAKASNPSGNDFRHARKCQTTRETTFAMRGNAKPFGKRLSPSAEMPNHSGNDFRHARKCQTIREMTSAVRGNAKPFGKRLSPGAEMPNHSGNDFRHARKRQTKGFYTSTRRITILSEGVLNNRPTLHLVCNVGRKTIEQNSLLIVLGQILCRNRHNLSVCIGYHYIFAF